MKRIGTILGLGGAALAFIGGLLQSKSNDIKLKEEVAAEVDRRMSETGVIYAEIKEPEEDEEEEEEEEES